MNLLDLVPRRHLDVGRQGMCVRILRRSELMMPVWMKIRLVFTGLIQLVRRKNLFSDMGFIDGGGLVLLCHRGHEASSCDIKTHSIGP